MLLLYLPIYLYYYLAEFTKIHKMIYFCSLLLASEALDVWIYVFGTKAFILFFIHSRPRLFIHSMTMNYLSILLGDI